MNQRRYKHIRTGFTLVELMVVLLVLGVLLTLLLPALNMVKKATLTVRQKAQFHTIEVGLEGFRADSDTGDYPDSYLPYPVTAATIGNGDEDYLGAQRLAEALIGQDGFGFHPRSLFRRDGRYDSDGDGSITAADDLVYDLTDPATREENLKARKGPYVEMENVNAVQLNAYGKTYDVLSDASYDASDDYVFSDMYRTFKNAVTTKMIGMPILYYKANTSHYTHTHLTANVLNGTAADTNIYMMLDNAAFYSYPANVHPMEQYPDGYSKWYKRTTNPAFPGSTTPPPYPRPYRVDSFILQSAGPDGRYGSEDDVFNFEEKES